MLQWRVDELKELKGNWSQNAMRSLIYGRALKCVDNSCNCQKTIQNIVSRINTFSKSFHTCSVSSSLQFFKNLAYSCGICLKNMLIENLILVLMIVIQFCLWDSVIYDSITIQCGKGGL